MADEARWFRGSVPVFTPQRGWKPVDTTVKAFCCCWQKVCRRRQKGRKSPVGDTFLAQSTVVDKSMPPERKACRSSWKLRPLPVARCRRTDFHYIVFYRRTKSCFGQTADPCSCGGSWLLRRAWDSSSPMLLSSFRSFCIIELRVVFQHFAG